MLAGTILVLHLTVIAFNVAGLILIPLGAWRRWTFVRQPLWRVAHLACLAAVAVQAALGRACFLTVWQDQASGAAERTPLIMGFVNRLLFWPLPIWVFAVAYVAVFAYALGLLWLVPVRWRR